MSDFTESYVKSKQGKAMIDSLQQKKKNIKPTNLPVSPTNISVSPTDLPVSPSNLPVSPSNLPTGRELTLPFNSRNRSVFSRDTPVKVPTSVTSSESKIIPPPKIRRRGMVTFSNNPEEIVHPEAFSMTNPMLSPSLRQPVEEEIVEPVSMTNPMRPPSLRQPVEEEIVEPLPTSHESTVTIEGKIKYNDLYLYNIKVNGNFIGEEKYQIVNGRMKPEDNTKTQFLQDIKRGLIQKIELNSPPTTHGGRTKKNKKKHTKQRKSYRKKTRRL